MLDKQFGRHPTNLAVLSFRVSAYKCERDGVQQHVGMAHDAYAHNTDADVSMAITRVLELNGLQPQHIISLSGDTARNRDVGSWDFWLFCHNPDYVSPFRTVIETKLADPTACKDATSKAQVDGYAQMLNVPVTSSKTDTSGLPG